MEDKFPKSRYHWLVIARGEDFGSMPSPLINLRKHHIPLLKHMRSVAYGVMSRTSVPKTDFAIGFHRLPSMRQLHLHVISKDYDSLYLKTSKHWNSFTPDFFVPMSSLLQALENSQEGEEVFTLHESLLSESDADRVLKQDMVCFKCGIVLKNIPSLKSHQKSCNAAK